MVVYRSIPTSNRNALAQLGPVHNVVYRSIPTSNRNQCRLYQFYTELYIVLFLHQTATNTLGMLEVPQLYIVLFLHQTATFSLRAISIVSCISFYSYIKPQLSVRGSFY